MSSAEGARNLRHNARAPAARAGHTSHFKGEIRMAQATSAAAVPVGPQTGKEEEAFAPTAGYRRYVLGLLLVVGLFNFVDQQIFAILLQSIKVEFGFSDTQLGLLGGIAFGLFYAIMSLPIAWLAERYSRRNIIAVAIGLWSAMTALCGLADAALFDKDAGRRRERVGCSAFPDCLAHRAPGSRSGKNQLKAPG
jgi:hypothetical protein